MKLEALQNLGLAEKSARVYLAALSLGKATVQEVARKAGVKRPTAYLHIADLIQRGLMATYPSGKKELYQARDPVIFETLAEQRLQEIKDFLPDLRNLQNEAGGRPQITIMEGREAIRQIYKEICEANSIRFWSDLKQVEDAFQEMVREIAESINRNEVRTREIITDSAEARKSARRFAATAGKSYTARLAAKAGIQNDNAIYGDTVAMFRIHANNFFVVLIKEPTIAATMKALFDMAWESAVPFIGR